MLAPRRRLALALVAAFGFASLAQAEAAWIARSNEDAKPLLDVFGRFNPETAAQLGIPGYDTGVVDLKADVNRRFREASAAAKQALEAKLAAEKDPQVRQDLQIMIDSAQLQIDSSLINEKYLLPYNDIGQIIFQGEFALLQDEVAAKRRASALVRLNRYVGLEKGYTPLTELAKQRFAEQAGDKALLGPFKRQVEQSVANTQRYIDGVRKLYAKYQIKGADKALATLETQLKDYAEWTRSTVLPRTREDFRLPEDLYADNLKNVGLDIPPHELVAKAELAFAEIRNQMQALAPLVAKEHHLDVSDYRDVIRALKKDQIPADQIESTYAGVIGKIEDIIRTQHIVTLPQRAMVMRVASEAESAAQPAPHMDPPALVGNKGERGTFVLTRGNPDTSGGSQAYDDFSHKGATWTLTAHEGRPGHELQFSAMVERGVSLARTLFAFNSVNVEGWALYAEAEMQPYEPLAGQLFALQARLQRAARAILDPKLNLGEISRERAMEVLTQDVVLSQPMAQQEVDRYTFRAPGQATAYFYGYTKLMELRTEAELALGKDFDRQAFNDFVIGQGLLPPALLRKAVMEDFIPHQAKK